MKVAYLGDENSFSFAAAQNAGFCKESRFLGFATIRECFEALTAGAVERAVVPVENSVEGAVNETLDSFLTANVYITAEIRLKITHSLIGLAGAKKEDVTAIYSHPQALAQCREFLAKNFPRASVEAAKSTSDAIARIDRVSAAAIGRKADGARTRVLISGVEDGQNNVTRFFALAAAPVFEGTRCSVVFDTANEPGALLKILAELAAAGLNMTKIESRPAKTNLGRYVFFVDFDLPGGKDALMAFLPRIQAHTGLLKFLGMYNEAKEI
ncbi:MAG: prephenate dehydratase [Clostridiales bacterium]|jgi:prephenate dehydratase|nr:prephenate dehydratase [Clostridiales bacterium]